MNVQAIQSLEQNIMEIEAYIATVDHDTLSDTEWLDLMGLLDFNYAMMEMHLRK